MDISFRSMLTAGVGGVAATAIVFASSVTPLPEKPSTQWLPVQLSAAVSTPADPALNAIERIAPSLFTPAPAPSAGYARRTGACRGATAQRDLRRHQLRVLVHPVLGQLRVAGPHAVGDAVHSVRLGGHRPDQHLVSAVRPAGPPLRLRLPGPDRQQPAEPQCLAGRSGRYRQHRVERVRQRSQSGNQLFPSRCSGCRSPSRRCRPSRSLPRRRPRPLRRVPAQRPWSVRSGTPSPRYPAGCRTHPSSSSARLAPLGAAPR